MYYLSPERFRQHKGWELLSSDVWALGVSLYEMLCGCRCFHAQNEAKIIERIRNGQWQWPQYVRLSSNCKQFIQV